MTEQLTKTNQLDEKQKECALSKADTLLNISLAEINSVHDERVRDVRAAATDFFDDQIKYYEDIAAQLKKCREFFDEGIFQALDACSVQDMQKSGISSTGPNHQMPSFAVNSAKVAATIGSALGDKISGYISGSGTRSPSRYLPSLPSWPLLPSASKQPSE